MAIRPDIAPIPRLGLLTFQPFSNHKKLTVNLSQLMNLLKPHLKKANIFSTLKTGSELIPNYGPSTLIIIMMPAASLTHCCV